MDEAKTSDRMFVELRELAQTRICPNCRGCGTAVIPCFGFNPGNYVEYGRCMSCGGKGRVRK